MKSVVFEFAIPHVVTIRITGSNDGRYERYCKRLDVAEGTAESLVGYTASDAGQWKLQDVGTAEVSREHTGIPVFFETTYQVRCNFAKEAGVTEAYVFHEMKSVADEFYFEDGLLDGRLDFVNVPGQFTFEVDYVANGKPRRLKLKWWVVSEKIDVVKDVKAIKGAIEKENKGFVYSFLSQTKGAAGLSRQKISNNGEWLDIFRLFYEPYRKAVEWIVHSPHLRYQPEVEYVRADRVRRWTPQLVNKLKSMDRERQERALFRVEQICPKVDTPENRFVLFTLSRISDRLKVLEEMCRRASNVADLYADRVKAWKKDLDRYRTSPFFRAIGKFRGFKQESLVLQRQRGYSKIFETWVALQHALDVTKDGLDAGNRPIWKLYEFWCYLVIRDYLKEKTVFEVDEAKSGLGSLLKIKDVFNEIDPEDDEQDENRPDKGQNKCQYVFNDKIGNRTITLTYQQSYSNAASADVDGANVAHIVEQIPDIVLSIVENGGEKNQYTYLFDAKYQIMSLPSVLKPEIDAAPYKTINEMHRYRDAILYRRQKQLGEGAGRLSHEIIGAYVLFPGRPDKSWGKYGAFIDQENIGAIPLLPGDDGKKALHGYLDKFLAYSNKGDHLKVALPPRGAEISLEPVVTEDMILTVTDLSFDEAKTWVDKCFYAVRKADLKKAAEYRQIRFRHSGNADMYVNIDTSEEKPAKFVTSLPGFFKSAPDELVVVFRLQAQ